MSMRVLEVAAALVLLASYGAVEATAQRGGGFRLPPLLMETDAFPDGGLVWRPINRLT
jgi:hypothetical protein